MRLVEQPTASSPRISGVSWGRMEVEGFGQGKDFKLYPGGGREWDWADESRACRWVVPFDLLGAGFDGCLSRGSIISTTRGGQEGYKSMWRRISTALTFEGSPSSANR